MTLEEIAPPPKLTAEDLRRRAEYRSGFCGLGWCEGLRPKSYTGKPVKVCVDTKLCQCECHKKITRMYELAGIPRVTQQNPDYVPYMGPDLSWIKDERVPPAPFVPAQPFTLDAGERSAADDTAPTTGDADSPRPDRDNRLRGWLEIEVKKICDRKMSGEIDDTLTPKSLAIWIDPENPPSQGAVGAVLERWSEIGFAAVNKNPVRFVSYTVKGMNLGLERMRSDAKHNSRSK